MTLNDFIYCMQIGEELELHIDGRMYFLQPNYGEQKKNIAWTQYDNFFLYDITQNYEGEKVCCGCLCDIIDYIFNGKYTLKNDFEKFKILW